jgi:hypothetical protein
MSVTSAEIMKGMHNVIRAAGEKSINSDAYFEPVGYQAMGMLAKQFPWPILSTTGEIEIAGPGGSAMWDMQSLKFNKQGPVTFMETRTGAVYKFLRDLHKSGGKFPANVYEGVSSVRFYRGLKLFDCFLQLDDTDRDWENRSQITTISGTLFYHFYGDEIPGNII